MKRLSTVLASLLFASVLVGVTGVGGAHAASIPASLKTCTNINSGAIRVLSNGLCATTESKGLWVTFYGAATTKVIFTCMSNAGALKISGSGACSRKADVKTPWIKSANSPSDSNDTRCAKGGSCVVGDIGPGGGMIVYVARTVQPWGRYLEVADGKVWASSLPGHIPGTRSDPQMVWCNHSNVRVGASGTKIGSGLANTKRIVAKCKKGAAVAARAFRGGGKKDWFLPSRDELVQMYQTIGGVFGFFPDHYWSSTENGAQEAWDRSLELGTQGSMFKNGILYVRPVRVF